MEQIIELNKADLVEISGGESLVYKYMYIQGRAYAVLHGVIDGFLRQ